MELRRKRETQAPQSTSVETNERTCQYSHSRMVIFATHTDTECLLVFVSVATTYTIDETQMQGERDHERRFGGVRLLPRSPNRTT